MRHAYLIMAHNEFGVLQKLVEALDDMRNDIFVHIDKKVAECPLLRTVSAGLYYIRERIDVRWGSVSQIKAEYALFEEAYRRGQGYSRYHLISGTHLPLRTQNFLHAYFAKQENFQWELLRYIYTNAYEVNMKLGRYHLFLNGYKHKVLWVRWLFSKMWHLALKIQYFFGIQRAVPPVNIKANNWVSLTDGAVGYIVRSKAEILKVFRWSFCGDEYFVPYLLQKGENRFKLRNDESFLYNDIQENANARVLGREDYKKLKESGSMFARKFSEQDMDVVNEILRTLKN
ncbi:beta-1,6-N-acetylglucosaminyltransferase [Sphingobacterium suaedae]|uniref:Peptide O-xylosyltransferase n=1 Tax=Sphingobacterium suaedae TaxID=1686402 RepID=A0ABW5KLJ9_9SPHI